MASLAGLPTTSPAVSAEVRSHNECAEAPAAERREHVVPVRVGMSGSPQPLLQRRAIGSVVAGRVYFRASDGAMQAVNGSVPIGALVDARSGDVSLTFALPDGKVQTGEFYGGEFRASQACDGMVTLSLAGPLVFGAGTAGMPGATLARASSSRPAPKARVLWGTDKHGMFTTKGQYAAGTVNGTQWLAEDFSGFSLFYVTHGRVVVRDNRRHRIRVVASGRCYQTSSPNVCVPPAAYALEGGSNGFPPPSDGDAETVTDAQGAGALLRSIHHGYGLISIPLPARAPLSQLSQLSVDYSITQGTCLEGSPRFELKLLPPGDTQATDEVTLRAFIGPGATELSAPSGCPIAPAVGAQANVITTADPVPRWNAVMGGVEGPASTFGPLAVAYGSYQLVGIDVTVDGGQDQPFSDVQRVRIGSLSVNGNQLLG